MIAAEEAEVAPACAALLGAERPEAASAERLKVGNTNALYRLRVDGRSFLARVFGSNPALAFDRDAENRLYAKLSGEGLAPRLVATFANGRIEEWVEGRPATVSECRTSSVSRQVAAQLARLHHFAAPPAKEPWAWSTARGWQAGARSAMDSLQLQREQVPLSPHMSEVCGRALQMDLGRLAGRAGDLELCLAAEALPLGFAHNDLSNTNVHLDPASATVRLIDFEYGGANYRGFDLATHLSHWAGGALDGLYEDGKFPAEMERRDFLEAYASAASVLQRGGEPLAVEALQREVALATPLAHLVWGLWALCMLPTVLQGPPGPFSHIDYAERRLRAFEASMQRLGI